MTMESMDSRWQKETVTLLPSIESVSSTAMVMQVKNYVFFCNKQIPRKLLRKLKILSK